MYIKEFIEYLQYEKRYSPRTIEAYKEDLEQLYKFLQEEYGTMKAINIHQKMVRAWLVSMIEKGLNKRSVVRKLYALRTYYICRKKSKHI